MRNVRTERWNLVAAAVFAVTAVAGCGDRETTTSGAVPGSNGTAAPDVATTAPVTDATSLQQAPVVDEPTSVIDATSPADTSVPITATTLDSAVPAATSDITSTTLVNAFTLGPVNFSLPVEAVNRTQASNVPDFVIATHTWSVSDKGKISVAIQNVVPLFPDRERVSEFDVNGLHWRVYDTGPDPVAYAVLDGTTAVLVGGQAWTDASHDLIGGYVNDVVRSLTYQGANK